MSIVQAYRDCLRTSFRTACSSKIVPVLARALSTESNFPNTKTSPSPANETLSLLRRAITLLPRALNIKQDSGSTRAEGSADFWNAILSNTYEDLSATTERPAKIVGSCNPFYFDLTIDCLSQYVV